MGLQKETPADAGPAGVLGPSEEGRWSDLPLLAAGLLASGLLGGIGWDVDDISPIWRAANMRSSLNIRD